MSRFASMTKAERLQDPAISLPVPCRHREGARNSHQTLRNGTRTFYCTDCNRLVFQKPQQREVEGGGDSSPTSAPSHGNTRRSRRGQQIVTRSLNGSE